MLDSLNNFLRKHLMGGTKFWFVFIVLTFSLCFGYRYYAKGKNFDDLQQLIEFVDVFLIIFVSLIIWIIQKIIARLNWLHDASRSRFRQIEKALQTTVIEKSSADMTPAVSHWPWGAHHTEALGHLEAAAKKWWYFYEPGDPSTAPTNEMVSDWLRSERGVSKEKAQAIASMLRADGLKAGPRR